MRSILVMNKDSKLIWEAHGKTSADVMQSAPDPGGKWNPADDILAKDRVDKIKGYGGGPSGDMVSDEHWDDRLANIENMLQEILNKLP